MKRLQSNKMKIGFFGTPEYTTSILEVLLNNFKLSLIVTAPDSKQGRHQILTPSPIKKFATAKGLESIILDAEDENLKYKIKSLNLDLAVVAAYGYKIENDILNSPKLGFINAHPSLLPKYRGPSPIQTTLLNGDKTTGLTFIKLDDQIDHGPILDSFPFEISNDDNNLTLHEKLFKLASKEITEIINKYKNNKLKLKPQDDTKATYTKKITKTDGFFSIQNPPEKSVLTQMIRAYYPWPTTWTKYKLDDKGEEKIIKFLPNNLVQIEGRRASSLKEILNGYPNLRSVLDFLS